METKYSHWSQALEKLMEGNQRFTSGLRSTSALLGHEKVRELAANGQKPFAIVVSCSDSRVPAELLFDCGFGELFVVRVAGNVVQPSQIASIEYGAKVLGASLCVIMGHSKCGAVQAALDSETGIKIELGPNIASLIALIQPSVQRVLRDLNSASQDKDGHLLDRCIRENAKSTASEVLEKSQMLRALSTENKFKVVEAVFHLENGKVEFLKETKSSDTME